MILLFVTMIMIMGSVAATDTTSNNNIELQSTNNNVVDNTTSITADTTTTQKTDSVSTNTRQITKVTNTSSSNNSVKSSSGSANSAVTNKKLSTNTKVYNITSTTSKITFKADVTTTNNAKVKNGTVVFKLNSITVGNTTVKNGGATLTYTIPSSWTKINYTITAVYAENSYYARSTSNSTLKIKSNLATKISVTDITTAPGNTVTLKAVITTSDGKYVKTGKAAFKINGKTVGTVNVNNGGAKLTYKIASNWASKSYNITVVYGANDYYKGAKANGTLKVNGKTNPKIAINTTSVISGKSTTFTTTITNSAGKTVNGGKVAFKINGKTIGHANVTKGVAKLTYTVPGGWNGNYNITVVYGGYENYNSVKKTTTLKAVKSVKPKITINTTSVYNNQSVVLTALVTDSSGNKINVGKGTFKINGKSIGTVNVVKGVATLKYSIPASWNGKYNITFAYGGSGKYNSSTKTTTLTVKKKTTGFTVPSGYEKYVKSTTNCDVTNSKIKSLAANLTSGVTDAYTAAVKIYNYVRDKVSYSFYMNTRYGSVGTLNNKVGNCVDQTHLLAALMRSKNIPTRYCHATCTFTSGLVVGHVWAEVYVNGKWYSCDTTSSRNSFNNIKNWYKSTTVYRYTSISF